MRQYHWNNCPAATRAQVEKLMSECWRIFGEDVTGIYLHGSLAMGCFHPETSDIDVLMVVERALNRDDVRLMAQLLLETSNQPHAIEISVLHREAVQTWQHPMPYAFHYSEALRHAFVQHLQTPEWGAPPDALPTDPDLAAHFVIARERGVVLYGEPVREVLPVVPTDDYIDALLYDFEDCIASINQKPVSNVLNLCRVYWFLAKGAICSKDEAGDWAVGYLAEAYRDVVSRALRHYREGRQQPNVFDPAQLHTFAAHIETQVRELLS